MARKHDDTDSTEEQHGFAVGARLSADPGVSHWVIISTPVCDFLFDLDDLVGGNAIDRLDASSSGIERAGESLPVEGIIGASTTQQIGSAPTSHGFLSLAQSMAGRAGSPR